MKNINGIDDIKILYLESIVNVEICRMIAVNSKIERIPTENEFRAAGYTKAAAQYPLNKEQQKRIADINNTTVESMSDTWRYAPNVYYFNLK